MTINEIFALQQELVSYTGPSGCEQDRAAFIAEYAKPYADEVFTDALGNLFVHKKGNGTRVMVDAHMDTTGFIADYIDERGFVKIFAVGGIETYTLPGERIRFRSGAIGVIAAEARAGIQNKKPEEADIYDLYADLGVKDRASALSRVSPGDPAVFAAGPYLQGNNMITPYSDDLLGCAVMMAAIKEAASGDNDMYYVFAVQEEVGCRGAVVAAERVRPEYALTLEMVAADDQLTSDTDPPRIRVGAGPVFRGRDKQTIYDAGFTKQLYEKAAESGICCQLRYRNAGSNNAQAIQKAGTGAKVACLSIANRYMHSPAEIVSLKDAQEAVSIVSLLPALELEQGI
ncbi:MAG: hypothetical protein J6P87_00030 [Lachnospiraceae bacterium]|nr:hypothetical protein [Lachnospiraceae bacterium]